MSKGKAKAATDKRINLALQGGGAHGAFSWGIIDRLLDEEWLSFDGIVGTSAGAMNAAVMAYGLTVDGRRGARACLHQFWKTVSDAAKTSPLQPSFLDKMMGPGNMDLSPAFFMFDTLSRVMSPYQLNPTNLNPLRDALAAVVDFAVLRRTPGNPLFICATNVRNGRMKVFERHEITVEAVMASACLPFIFQAVEVDGEFYWDGGYMGNPAIYPLIYNTETQDVLIAQINPINIPEVPKTAFAIADRINTLSWNASLMREMRAIHFVSKLIDGGFDDDGKLRKVFIHTIDAEDELVKYSVSSKLNADWDWLQHLFRCGQERAEAFLSAHADKIGRESSTDIEAKFL
ncbi:MAG: patatin-like phospholipase family protein [Xanthobacteraceae bacterium]|jgi:NTE family protein